MRARALFEEGGGGVSEDEDAKEAAREQAEEEEEEGEGEAEEQERPTKRRAGSSAQRTHAPHRRDLQVVWRIAAALWDDISVVAGPGDLAAASHPEGRDAVSDAAGRLDGILSGIAADVSDGRARVKNGSSIVYDRAR
jgi:hypothetical protein